MQTEYGVKIALILFKETRTTIGIDSTVLLHQHLDETIRYVQGNTAFWDLSLVIPGVPPENQWSRALTILNLDEKV